jgi:hypothetical protein
MKLLMNEAVVLNSLCLSVRLCPSVCLSVCPSVCPFVRPSVYSMEVFRGPGKDREDVTVDSVLTNRRQRPSRVKSRSAGYFHTVLHSAR